VIPRIAVTLGEPAGIGPDIVARLTRRAVAAQLVVIGDPALLAEAAAAHSVPLRIAAFDPEAPRKLHMPGSVLCEPVALRAAVTAGTLDRRNSPYVVETLVRASDGCLGGRFEAMVTAPVHKGVINDAGVPFTGHTEFLAGRARCDVVMLLTAEQSGDEGRAPLRVALATTHLPLRAVPDALDRATLERCLRVLRMDLRDRFGIERPRIAVLGLNPHAGEGGHLGREEIEVIAPVVEALRADGFHLDGPLAADTAFASGHAMRYDAILAMYHDQGLAPLKAVSWGGVANVTLGLPYVRTSVDHGVALDQARSARADPASLIEATRLAVQLAERKAGANSLWNGGELDGG
jgi:4-hydroxythreonine-4-phosphate dehydrogenase